MSRRRTAACGALALASSACAGGGPLLHPAQTLPKGEVRAAAGMSGNAALGSLGSSLRDARNDPQARAPGSVSDLTFAKGALVSALVAPGVAPFVSGRVGLGSDFEGGLGYTGRSARVDARRAFRFGEDRAWALSVGAGGSVALYGRQQGSPLPGVDLGQLRGYGVDVPLLVGYEATGGLYSFWVGARGGWEHDTIEQVTTETIPGSPPASLSGDRFWGGGVVGAAAGFRHVHVAIELDAAYQSVTGDYLGMHAHVDGVTLVPAGAVWWSF